MLNLSRAVSSTSRLRRRMSTALVVGAVAVDRSHRRVWIQEHVPIRLGYLSLSSVSQPSGLWTPARAIRETTRTSSHQILSGPGVDVYGHRHSVGILDAPGGDREDWTRLSAMCESVSSATSSPAALLPSWNLRSSSLPFRLPPSHHPIGHLPSLTYPISLRGGGLGLLASEAYTCAIGFGFALPCAIDNVSRRSAEQAGAMWRTTEDAEDNTTTTGTRISVLGCFEWTMEGSHGHVDANELIIGSWEGIWRRRRDGGDAERHRGGGTYAASPSPPPAVIDVDITRRHCCEVSVPCVPHCDVVFSPTRFALALAPGSQFASKLSTRRRALSSGRDRVRDAKETLLVTSKPKRRLAEETRWQALKTLTTRVPPTRFTPIVTSDSPSSSIPDLHPQFHCTASSFGLPVPITFSKQ
ncbi:hypothetical protein B0H13DRAFT_2660601 [Mycena leptocephala]|nr:hypothetical protein B0H13DRAFT_2660601 [Mycena leptocephala]